MFAGGPTNIEQRLRGGETGDKVNEREKDTAVISDDRRTLEVSARVFKNMDQVRVLVGTVNGDLDSPEITTDNQSSN